MGARRRWTSVVGVIGVLWACPALTGSAVAAGELTQKAGTAGCVSDTGAGPCLDGKALDSAFAVAVSADGKSTYAVSEGGSVVVFDRDPTTGTLTQKAGTAGCISETGTGGLCVDGNALIGARSVVVSADGKNVYTASQSSSAVAIFDRDVLTGALTQKAGTAGCISNTGTGPCVDGNALGGARSVVVSADGKNIYTTSVTSDAVAVFDRDVATGALTQKAGTAGCISQTGTGGTCADGKTLDGPTAVAVSADGRSAYAASSVSDAVAIFDRDVTTGALTQKAGAAGCISGAPIIACVDGRALVAVSSVVVSADGKSVYAASEFSDAVAILDRDVLTGALTQNAGAAGCISNTGTGPCVEGKALNGARSVVVSADGRNVYAASGRSDAVAVFDRDVLTGALTQKAATAGCVSETGTSGTCVDGKALVAATSVAVTADGKNLYVASPGSDAVAVFDRVRVAAVSLPAVARLTTSWLLRDSATTGAETTPSFTFGTRPAVPLMGDWDGNGSRTPGSLQGGTFMLNNANDDSAPDITFTFGDPRGFPLAGDFNGDGTDDVAVYRNGLWQTRLSTGVESSFMYAAGAWPATVPITGDWNGDGTDGIGTYTYNTATWNLKNLPAAGATDIGPIAFGTPNSSYPVPGDWNGDAIDTIATKTTTTWDLRNTNTAGAPDLTFTYGLANDLPLSWRLP